MSKKFLAYSLTLGCLVAVLAPAPAQATQCGPLNNGRVADVFYDASAVYFDPVVEFRTMTLTIGGPCEDIVKTFGPKDKIFFDLEEIERIVDGEYSWELHREATVDEGVQEDLEASRGTGKEDALWWSYWQEGLIPEGPYVDSGSFTVVKGQIIDPSGTSEERSGSLATKDEGGGSSAAIGATLAGGLGSGEASVGSGGPVLDTKTVLTNGDGIIRNSLCVGFDCPDNPTFDDTTILMMENNTRVKFDDTSSISSFPRNDWEIEANSRLDGGASYLGFNDCGQSSQGGCASDLVFAVEAGVRQNAIYAESDGDVGFGTNNPVVRLHTIDGDTPALRLEQDGSSGFAPQTWDVAGNETSFFIRDATNGSTLPFRIQPGASSNVVFIANDDDVGFGTTSPSQALHVRRTDGGASVFIEEASGTTTNRDLLTLHNNGAPQVRLQNTSSGIEWSFSMLGNNDFAISQQGTGGPELSIEAGTGTVDISGDLNVAGTKNFAVPDPDDPSKRIVFSALEGPEAGTYYRGTAKIVAGKAVIELPEHFAKMTEGEGLTVQLTPLGGWHSLYVASKSPDVLVIRDAENGDDIEFDFFVQGVRKGYKDFPVERPAPAR